MWSQGPSADEEPRRGWVPGRPNALTRDPAGPAAAGAGAPAAAATASSSSGSLTSNLSSSLRGWFNRQEQQNQANTVTSAVQSALPDTLRDALPARLVGAATNEGNALALQQLQDFGSTSCPGLTLKQRFYGVATCMAAGALLDLCSFGRMSQLFHGDGGGAERYAIMYTIGNIIALTGTFFLAGPARQCQRLKSQRRWMASSVFFASMAITLLVACTHSDFHGRAFVILVLVMVQWVSFIWYVLSYIPYGPQMCLRGLQSFCCGNAE